MDESPIVVLLNKDGGYIDLGPGVTISGTQTGIISAGVDSGGISRFIKTDTSGNIVISSGSGLALDSTLSTLSGKFGTLGQKTMSGSAPVVVASDQSAIPTTNLAIGSNGSATPTSSSSVGVSDGTNLQVLQGRSSDPVGTELGLVTRNIGVSDLQVTGTIAVNGGIVTSAKLNNITSCNIVVSGVWVGTLQFEVSVDGTNYIALTGRVISAGTTVTNTTTNNTWRFVVAAYQYVRVRASAWTSGTATVNIRLSGTDTSILTESLPTGGNVIGGVTGSGNFNVVGPGAVAAAISGNPVRIGASDGTLTRNILSDTTGRLVVVGGAGSGTAVSGSPVLVGGSDGTNARNIVTDTTGRLIVVGVGTGAAVNVLDANLTSGTQITQIGNASNTVAFMNSAPAGTEYGLVTRNIPNGVQAVSGNLGFSTVACFNSYSVGVVVGLNKSMTSIMNTSSTKIIKIRGIYIYNSQISNVMGMIGVFIARKMTGHSSGTLISVDSFDSVDTLDAGVTVRTGATVTGASSNILQKAIMNTSGISNQILPGPSAAGFAGMLIQNNDAAKPMTLRQGEGLTINFESTSSTGSYDINVVFTQE